MCGQTTCAEEPKNSISAKVIRDQVRLNSCLWERRIPALSGALMVRSGAQVASHDRAFTQGQSSARDSTIRAGFPFIAASLACPSYLTTKRPLSMFFARRRTPPLVAVCRRCPTQEARHLRRMRAPSSFSVSCQAQPSLKLALIVLTPRALARC